MTPNWAGTSKTDQNSAISDSGEIKALAGVDYLTIAPKLLEELKNSTEAVPQLLASETAKKDEPIAKVSFVDDEPKFRWSLLEDQMAFEKVRRAPPCWSPRPRA